MGSVDTMMDYRRCTCPVLPLSCCCWFTCPMNQSSRTCSPSTGWAVADAGRHSPTLSQSRLGTSSSSCTSVPSLCSPAGPGRLLQQPELLQEWRKRLSLDWEPP